LSSISACSVFHVEDLVEQRGVVPVRVADDEQLDVLLVAHHLLEPRPDFRHVGGAEGQFVAGVEDGLHPPALVRDLRDDAVRVPRVNHRDLDRIGGHRRGQGQCRKHVQYLRR
jgi:hypothetical protein